MSNAQQSQTTGSGLPAEVRNLHIGNDRTAFVLLTQPVAVREVLTVAGFGSQLFTGGRSLTLLSDATGTALVNNAGGQVVGDVTVQRFINSAYRGVGYRHYSAPISTATVGSLATGGFGPVVNAAYNTALHPEQTTPYPTVYGYDEARLATSQAVGGAEFDKGWVSPASLLAPLVAGRGYTVHVPGTAVVSFTGPLNQTAVSSDFLARGPGADVGWQLVGNPYPSPLDVSTLTMGPGTANNLRNVGAAVYVFESTGPYVGQYRTAVAGVGGSSVIASGQGFFVRALPDPTGQLPTQVQFFNSNRVTTFSAGDNTFRRPAAETRPLLTLGLRDAAGHTDPASIYFTPAATPGFDPTADATKLPNTTGLNLASLVGSESYAINALPLLGTAPLVVPLTVDVPATGSYELAVDQLLNFTPGTTLYLRDALLNTLTPLTATTRYAFTLPGTSAPGRFSVEFRPAGALATAAQVLAARLQLYPNPTRAGSRTVLTLPAPAGERVSATLLNALGQTVSAFALPVRAGQAMALLPTAGLAAGVYVLRVQAGATVITKRLVID
jgi:hypothetical protein